MSTLADIDPGYWDALREQPGYLSWLGRATVAQPGGIGAVCTGAFWALRKRGDTVRLRP